MAELNFPWEMFMQAAQAKRQNQQDMLQNISQLGQSLGQAGQDYGKSKALDSLKTLMAKASQPTPQGVQGSATGGVVPNFMQQAAPIMSKLDPQGMISNLIQQNDPYKQALTKQALATAEKDLRPPKEPMEWSTFPGSSGGKPLEINKVTGEVRVAPGITGYKPGKSDTDDWKHMLEQDKLEKEYSDRVQRVIGARTGGLGLQDQKVDQAIHLRAMVNQAWNPKTGTYELPEMQQGELVMGLANLVSGSSVSNIEQLRSITPRTARGDMAHLISYWSGKPLTNQPQDMIKNLISSIDRQGLVSEKLRDKYVSGLKSLRPKMLDQDRADAISKAQLASSFSDILKESPDQQVQGGRGLQPYSDQSKEARYQAWKKSNGY